MKNIRFAVLFALASTLGLSPNLHACCLGEEEQGLVRDFHKLIGFEVKLDNQLVRTGFDHIYSSNGLSEDEIFNKGRQLQTGKVKRLEKPSVEKLFLQWLCFKSVRTLEDNLYCRALHNLAVTQVDLADSLKPRASEGIKSSTIPYLYQEAWYLFSLAGFPQSKNNLTQMVEDDQIACVIGNSEVDRKIDTVSTAQLMEIPRNCFNDHLKGKGEDLERTLEYIMKIPFKLELGKMVAENGLAVDPIRFTKETYLDLLRLFGQLINVIGTTPRLRPEQRNHPVTIFMGPSTDWLSIIQEKLAKQLPGYDFKHVLVSGLSHKKYSDKQLKGFNAYLDSLGFGDIAPNRTLILTDVAEASHSLKYFGRILEERYGFTDIQYALMMLYGQTLNFERARVIYSTDRLSTVMCAKYDGKAMFCPFPRLYSTHWSDWEKYLLKYKMPDEAQKIRWKLEEWLEGPESKEGIALITDFASQEYGN